METIRFRLLLLVAALSLGLPAGAQLHRGARTVVRGGLLEKPDSLKGRRDSLRLAGLVRQIDSIAASIPDQQLVHDAKYGDNPCTAQELCFRVMQASAASGQNFLAAYQAEGAKSGAADVGAAPNGGAPASAQEQDAADIQAVVSAYNQTKGGTK